MSEQQAQQTIIRPALISSILNKKFESNSSQRKQELKEELTSLFYKYDGVAYSDTHDKARQERAQLAETKKQSVRLSKLRNDINGLDASKPTAIHSWAINKNILIPDDVFKSDYKTYLMKIYDEKITSIKAEIDRLDASTKNYVEILKNCNKDVAAFNSAHKTEYTAWKTQHLKENTVLVKELKSQLSVEEDEAKKKEIETTISKHESFQYLVDRLTEALDKLTPLQREQYRLRIEKDKISSKMVRFASTNKHLSHYSNEILKHFIENVLKEYVDRILNQDRDKLMLVGYKFPPVTENHIVPERFKSGAIRDLYMGALEKELGTLGEVDRESKLYGCVKTIVTNAFKQNNFTSKSVCDDKVIDIIYRTLCRFINVTSSMISEAAKKDGIKTFQEKIITGLFSYTFRINGGTPYSEPKPKNKKK